METQKKDYNWRVKVDGRQDPAADKGTWRKRKTKHEDGKELQGARETARLTDTNCKINRERANTKEGGTTIGASARRRQRRQEQSR